MEEMNNVNVENTVTAIVEEATDKLTFGENCLGYGLATVFGIGVVTVGYLGYKGVGAIVKKIKAKKECKEESEEEVVDVEYDDIHEVKDEETEKE